MSQRVIRTRLVAFTAVCCQAAAAFEINYTISNPNQFTTAQLSLLTEALARSKSMWESVVVGYQPGLNVASIPIQVQWSNAGLASATFLSTTTGGGFTVATSGLINVNADQLEPFANWQGPGANGLNFLDELLAHETGHVLGIGTLWAANGVYDGAFHYTGAHGVAAYKAEFDAAATFIPVEDSGSAGTRGAHWDQRMRSSAPSDPDQGNPADPWSLSPLVGVTDQYGRDRALDLMSGAIDPDYGEPFLSRFTVESLRDLGYRVTSFEDFNHDGTVNAVDLSIWRANVGATALQIDSMRFGDADRDRDVDGNDFLLWQRRLGSGGSLVIIPEPGGLVLAISALALSRLRAPRRARNAC